MSNCTECTQTETICEKTKPCGCPIQDLSTDCVKYDGPTLECSGIIVPNTLTQIIQKLDAFICEKIFNTFIGELLNIGGASEIYKQTNSLTGRQEIRTLESSDSSVEITQETDTIDFKVPGVESTDETVDVTTNINGNYDLSVSTLNNTSTVQSSDGSLNVAEPTANNFDVKLDLKSADSSVNITPHPTTDGEYDFSLNLPENYRATVQSSDNTIDVTEPTAGDYDISFTQKQSDVLEEDNTDPAFIKNKNPQKTITNVDSPYTLKVSDNNYVIVADTTAGDITITAANNALPDDNYFVGFIQKGTGKVTMDGWDIKPDSFTNQLKEQGSNASIEIVDTTAFLFGHLIPA